MKNKTKKGLQRILSLFLTLATIITTVLTGVTFNPVVAEAATGPIAFPANYSEAFVLDAAKYLGGSYVASGRGPSNFDCTGLLARVMIDMGFTGGMTNGTGNINWTTSRWQSQIADESLVLYYNNIKLSKNNGIIFCSTLADYNSKKNNPDYYGNLIVLKALDYSAIESSIEVGDIILSDGHAAIAAMRVTKPAAANHAVSEFNHYGANATVVASQYNSLAYLLATFDYLSNDSWGKQINGATTATRAIATNDGNDKAGAVNVIADANNYISGTKASSTHTGFNQYSKLPAAGTYASGMKSSYRITSYLYTDSNDNFTGTVQNTMWRIEALSTAQGVALTNKSGGKNDEQSTRLIHFNDTQGFYPGLQLQKVDADNTSTYKGGAVYAVLEGSNTGSHATDTQVQDTQVQNYAREVAANATSAATARTYSSSGLAQVTTSGNLLGFFTTSASGAVNLTNASGTAITLPRIVTDDVGAGGEVSHEYRIVEIYPASGYQRDDNVYKFTLTTGNKSSAVADAVKATKGSGLSVSLAGSSSYGTTTNYLSFASGNTSTTANIVMQAKNKAMPDYYTSAVRLTKAYNGTQVKGAVYALVWNGTDTKMQEAAATAASKTSGTAAIDSFNAATLDAGVAGYFVSQSSGTPWLHTAAEAKTLYTYTMNGTGSEPTTYSVLNLGTINNYDHLDLIEIYCPTGYKRDSNVYKFTVTSTNSSKTSNTRGTTSSVGNTAYDTAMKATTISVAGISTSGTNTTTTSNESKISVSGYSVSMGEDKKGYSAIGIQKVDSSDGTTLVAGATYCLTTDQTTAANGAKNGGTTGSISTVESKTSGISWFATQSELRAGSHNTYYIWEASAPTSTTGKQYNRNTGYWKVYVSTVEASDGTGTQIDELRYFSSSTDTKGTALSSENSKTIRGYRVDATTDYARLPEEEKTKYYQAAIGLEKKNDSGKRVAGAVYAVLWNAIDVNTQSAATAAQATGSLSAAITSFDASSVKSNIIGYFVTGTTGYSWIQSSADAKKNNITSSTYLALNLGTKDNYDHIDIVEIYCPAGYKRDSNVYNYKLTSSYSTYTANTFGTTSAVNEATYTTIRNATKLNIGNAGAATGVSTSGTATKTTTNAVRVTINSTNKYNLEGTNESISYFNGAFSIVKYDASRSNAKIEGVEFSVYRTLKDAQNKTNPLTAKLITDKNGTAKLVVSSVESVAWIEGSEATKTYFVRETDVSKAKVNGKLVSLVISNDIHEFVITGIKDSLFTVGGASGVAPVGYRLHTNGVQNTGALKALSSSTASVLYTEVPNVETPVYGQFGVMKIDGVTGLGVDGIKFNAYSDVALKTLLGSQTSANGGYARFVVSDLDTKPWYTYDTLTKTFYVQEDKASAEGKGYEWNSTIYKVVVTGAASANNCTVEFTNAATGAKLSGADIGERVVGSTKYAYFVQRNQPKKLGGEMGVTKYYTDVLGNEIPLNGVVFGVYSDAACTKEITTITTNNGYAIITTDTLDNKAAWYATGAITKTYYFKEKDVSKATRASDGVAVQLRMSTDVVMAVVTGVEIEKISTEGKNKVVYTIGDKEVDSMYLDNGRVKAFKMENFPKGLMGAVEVEKVDNANKPVTGINFNIYKQTDYDATNKAIKDKAVAIGSVSTVNGVAHADISTLSDGVIPAGAWKPESGTTKIFYIQEANPEGFTWNKTIIKAEVIGSETDPNGTKVTYTYILPTGEETTTKPVIKNTKITDVPGQKKFADNSNTLVKELYLTLYDATTNTVVTKNVYGENITSTVEVMKLADYKTTWKDLPYYDANGNVIKYSVKETKVVLTNGTVLDTEAKINGYFSREGTLTSDGVHLITNTAKEVFGKYAIQKIDADGNHDIYSKFFIYSDEKCEKQVGELSTNPSTGYAESNIISWLRAESMTKTFYAKEVENDGKHTLYPYTIKIVVAGEENVSNCKVTYSTLPLTGAALENAIANGYTGDITVDGSYIAIVPNNSITLTVSKKDITGKNELAGATLTIYKATKDGNGKYTKGDVLKIDGKDATWVSTNTNKVFDMFPAGHYVLVETIAPNGFALAEEVGFTVDQNKVVNQVTMLDDYTNVYIYKVDTEGKDVNGAELTLYDASNTALVKWSTGSNGAVISVNNAFTAEMVTYNGHKAVHIQRLVGGTTYRVVETKVPDGYVKAADVTIVPNKTTVAYEATMIDKPIEMEFSKVDRNGTEIEGATLTLYKATVGSNGKFVKGEKYISWVSGVDGRNADGSIKTHILKNIPAGNYILEETSAPTDHGFVKAESVEVVVKAIEGLQTAPKMVDDHTELHITKTDLVTGSEIVGATLQLIDKNGKVVVEWTTGNTNTTATKVNSQTGMTAYQKYDATSKKTELIVERIPVGTYTLREISAPNGYWVAEDVTIVIKEVGHLVEIQKAEMKDAPTETFFEKVDLVDGKPIKGATLTIYKSDKNKTKGAVVDSWVSDGTPHKILRLTDGYYLFEETNVPNGYKQAETIHFNYVQQSVAQRFVMKDDRYYGKVEVYKTDVDNKKLGNVSFGIYDKNGKLLETITTDADGYAITKNEYPVDEKDSNGNLHWLTYTIKEISAPAGYVITFKDMSFTFEGSTVVSGTYVARANAVNDYTRLYVNKYVAGTKNHLSGSVLAIYKVEDGKAVGDALYTWTTNGSSYYIDKIPAGNYVLREMEAPKGYFLAEDVFFTVKDTNANQTVDMEDRLLSKLPTTGKADGLMVMLFSLITSLSGCVVLFKRRRYAK